MRWLSKLLGSNWCILNLSWIRALDLSGIASLVIHKFVRYRFRFARNRFSFFPSKYFVRLQDIWKTISKHILKMSWKHVLKAFSALQFPDFQDVLKASWRSLPRQLEDIFGRGKIVKLKTFSRRLEDMSGRRLQEVLEINKCFLEYMYLSFFLFPPLVALFAVWVTVILRFV